MFFVLNNLRFSTKTKNDRIMGRTWGSEISYFHFSTISTAILSCSELWQLILIGKSLKIPPWKTHPEFFPKFQTALLEILFIFPICQEGQKPLKWFCDFFTKFSFSDVVEINNAECSWTIDKPRDVNLVYWDGASFNTIGRGSSSDLQNEFSLRSFTNCNVHWTCFTFIKIEN